MEAVKDKTFKEKFEELNSQLVELLQHTSPEELEKEGIRVLLKKDQPKSQEIPTINPEPKTEQEFLENLVARLTGNKNTFILQKSDTVTPEEVKEYIGPEKPVVVPSLVFPRSSEYNFIPYILFFTPDGLLAMLPYDDTCFSDAEPKKFKLRIPHDF